MRGLVAGIQRVGSAVLAVVFGIAATRLAGADTYGVYLSVMAISGLMATITTLGIPTQLGRELAMERGGGSQDGLTPLVDTATLLLVGLGVASLTAALAGAIYLAFAFAFALVKLALDLAMALYVGAEKVVTGGWIILTLSPSIALLNLFTIAWLGYVEAVYLFGAQIVTALCAFGIALVLAPRLASSALSLVTAPKLCWTPAHLRYLRTGGVLAITQALIGLSTQVDILVISAFRTSEEVAFYHAAARAALLVSVFSGMISAVAAPTLMRQISENDRVAQIDTVHRSSLSGFLITIIAFSAAIVLGPFYLSLYGPGFDSAYPVMVVLCFGFVIFSASGPAQMVLRAHRLDRIALWAMVGAVSVNLILSIILVGVLGPLGVSLATGTQFALMGVTMNLACRRKADLSIGPLAAVLSKPRGARLSRIWREGR